MHTFVSVLLVCLIPGTLGQYYFVTVPNVLRYEYDEIVTVSVFGLNNANVEVWLQLNGLKFSTKHVVVPNEESTQTTHVRVTENDITDYINNNSEKPSFIKICSRYSSSSECQDILISYKTGYIIVQTGKPIYTPKEKVQIRALVFDETLAGVKNETVHIDIISPSNLTLGRKQITTSSSGFYYTNQPFTLPPHAEIGLWTARASLKGQYDTNGRALFRVEEYVLPTFGVEIEVNLPYILQNSEMVSITVKAKYVYGKPVNGKARLDLNLRETGKETIHVLSTKRKRLVQTINTYSTTRFDIRVADILANNAIGHPFPNGKRLEVIATVYEEETGNEEGAIHDGTIFTEKPYQFMFSHSKLHFRPGFEYFLKLILMYANGAPVPDKEVEFLMFDNNGPNSTITDRTDSEGTIQEAFATRHGTAEIKFMVSVKDELTEDQLWTSDVFTVRPYSGKNQIHVEMVMKDGKNWMTAFTNTQGTSYTGMMFMVVSRGNVVHTRYTPSGNKVSEEFSDILEKKVSPSGRLIVFYVDKDTNEIVADSVKFNVRHMCRGKELSLRSELPVIKPGDNCKLTINGDSHMYVGLNVMDKALLLLNSKHVLRRNVMFDTLESHDLGCGEGSGSNSAAVFKSMGLKVLTNAIIDIRGLQRKSLDCEARLRKKRQALNDDCSAVDQTCCKKGIEFANDVFNETTDKKNIDALTVCLGKARQVVFNGTVKTLCIQAMYKSCLHTLLDLLNGRGIDARSLDFETEYISDLERVIEGGGKLRTRTDFRESWHFNIMQLDVNGTSDVILAYPESITEWMIQGIGISNKGVCMAEPTNVTTYQKFFVQLELPYKAKRLEHLEVKATIFNYGLTSLTANVYMDGIETLCYDRGLGKQSKRTQVELEPNSAHTIRFPMVPMKHGKLPVTVSAVVYDNGIPQTDAVKKYLNVEDEGIEEEIPIQVCLDPLEQADDCQHHSRVTEIKQSMYVSDTEQVIKVNLTLPQNSIPTTGTATAYLQGDIMDNVVRMLLLEGVDSLFRNPSGCAEQNMAKLAPTVNAMNYLKQTKQVTSTIQQRGNRLIREGVIYQRSKYRNPEGGYGTFSNRPRSIWLTAFVAKVFCQAKKVDYSAVARDDIDKSISWLVKHVKDDGRFDDPNPFRRFQTMRDHSLTAYVLIALQECSIQVPGLHTAIRNARHYLERIDQRVVRNDPYTLAISTYALALSKSNRRYEFLALLKQTKINSGKDGSHWGNTGTYRASAQSVETAAYALLAMLQFNDIKTSGEIVRWLTLQRDSVGAFRSTQDTVVGLQALSEYGIRSNIIRLDIAQTDLKITLRANKMKPKTTTITHENSVYQKVIKGLPVETANNQLTIQVSGTGTGRMMIDLRFNRHAKANEICGYNVSDIAIDGVNNLDINIGNISNADVCGKAGKEEPPEFYDDVAFGEDVIVRERKKRASDGIRDLVKCVKFSVSAAYEETGMTLVQFGLETGVEAFEEDLEKLRDETENIDAYEYSGQGVVVFYLNKGTLSDTDFIFRLKDTFDDEERQRSRQPAALTVYDYYNPDRTCTKMYRTIGETFSYRCDDSAKPQCQCLKNLCVTPSMGDKVAKMKNKPAIQLIKYICSAGKADYAVKVRMTDITYDENENQKLVTAMVLKSIHNGVKKLKRDDEMTFDYLMSCKNPVFNVGDNVYIIGQEGNTFINNHGEEQYMYPLMQTTLVLKHPRDQRYNNRFKNIMNKFANMISKDGCLQ